MKIRSRHVPTLHHVGCVYNARFSQSSFATLMHALVSLGKYVYQRAKKQQQPNNNNNNNNEKAFLSFLLCHFSMNRLARSILSDERVSSFCGHFQHEIVLTLFIYVFLLPFSVAGGAGRGGRERERDEGRVSSPSPAEILSLPFCMISQTWRKLHFGKWKMGFLCKHPLKKRRIYVRNTQMNVHHHIRSTLTCCSCASIAKGLLSTKLVNSGIFAENCAGYYQCIMLS